MRSEKIKHHSLNIAIVAVASLFGLMTSGCTDSSFSGVPQVQARPNPNLMHYAQNLSSSEPQLAEPIKNSNRSDLPFIGTQPLKQLDGTITIAEDGTATLKLQNSDNLFKPIVLEASPEPLLKDPEPHQLSAEGLIANGCITGEQTCESMLSEVTQKVSESAPDDRAIPTDDRFIYQNFSLAFFKQVLEINQDCGLSTAAPCSTRIYTFSEGSLTTKGNGTEFAEYTLSFHQPISESTAFSYLTILNQDREVNPTLSERSDRIPLQNCSDTALICEAELLLDSNGAISGVKLTHIQPQPQTSAGSKVPSISTY
ncbi:MAG: hypothetical protein MUC48_25370 [Leptolyngbya sp. Prado105]|nr:hypothetical protein [Leptolyngbya sp. Prado105]